MFFQNQTADIQSESVTCFVQTCIFFEDILFNEKIVSKYDQNQQIAFWVNVDLLCKNDRQSIKDFINMNKICLILLYYDGNRYSQWCCKEHFDKIKPEYTQSSNIMKPSMAEKLNILLKILPAIIATQDAEGAFTLFKLLILDISPCLAKFIINIFKTTFKNDNNMKWSKSFLEVLLKDPETPTILINTFAHSLPDVRFNIMELLYEIYKILQKITNKEISSGYERILKMLKTCLLPGDMFTEMKFSSSGSKKSSEIKSLAEHCVNAIKNRIPTPNARCGNEMTSIFKDNVYKEYISSINKCLLQWATDRPINPGEDESKVKLDKCRLRTDLSFIKLLFSFNDQMKSKEFTKDLFKSLNSLINIPENCLLLLNDPVILSWILNTTFDNSQSSDPTQYNIAEKGKIIIHELFAKSILHEARVPIKDRLPKLPILNLETMFQWGDGIREELKKETVLFMFMKGILEKLLDVINKELKPFNFQADKIDNYKTAAEFREKYLDNYNNKTYLYYITFVFKFSFYYTLEKAFSLQKMMAFIPAAISMPEVFVQNMRIESTAKNEKSWGDYFFVDDLIKKFEWMWSKNNVVKKDKILNEKFMIKKYEKILSEMWENIIEVEPKNPELYYNTAALFRRMCDKKKEILEQHILVCL